MNMNMQKLQKISNGVKILAIETSCDDTGVAILENNKAGQPKLLADLVSSQIKVHAPWGGVVPILAKREHQRHLTPLLIKAFKKARLLKIQNSILETQNLKLKTINSILDREPELLKKLLPFLQKYQKPDICKADKGNRSYKRRRCNCLGIYRAMPAGIRRSL